VGLKIADLEDPLRTGHGYRSSVDWNLRPG
jgi:hypothetical protein